ncbi:hypothetical protein LCGC14_1655660 [marine sediment metagenome]|uniref:TrmE-type G domain-containing protein n=1 Tax=marine sediment metagenome TaxID=412755 RepID=A0A0F9KBD1_9ZZZZ
MDTIFALASARGKAGVSVIRISGPTARTGLASMVANLPAPRIASVRPLISKDGAVLDHALVLCFERGHSFTGEETVELHVHGGVATINAVQAELQGFPRFRLAEPGEFTRRALYNNRMNLTEVEGLADVIDAETEMQRRQALRLMSGALKERVATWRERLVRFSALLEASLDFADDEIPDNVYPELLRDISDLASDLRTEIAGGKVAERVREGFEVAIIGSPNAGKSTLLNALVGRSAALTSEIAGTTRDVIEVRMDLDGLPITLLDTAGLRDSDDEIETMGVNLAKERADRADLRVFLLSDPDENLVIEAKPGDLIFLGKADLHKGQPRSVSGKTGAGLQNMLDEVRNELVSRVVPSAVSANIRHRQALEDGLSSLESACASLMTEPVHSELVAESLRSARFSLETVIGKVGIDDLLDEIFSRFCLGK